MTSDVSAEREEELVDIGRSAFRKQGCISCHTIDGKRLTGPALAEIYGKPLTLKNGRQVQRDRSYLYRSIVNPREYIAEGGPVVMRPYRHLDEQTLVGLVYFVRSLTDLEQATGEQEASASDE